MASFLWFGGVEALNHIILRLNLSARGIAPWRYDEWIRTTEKMGLIQPKAYKRAFYHPSLAKFYSDQSLKNNSRIRVKTRTWKDKAGYGILMLAFLALLLLPFSMRYWFKWYWASPHQIFIPQNDIRNAYWQPSDSGTYQVLRSGSVDMEAYGIIQVGTFVGVVLSPVGTREGFMGMPIESAYNLLGMDTCRHAALMVRKKEKGKDWGTYSYAASPDTNIVPINVRQGDLVQFIVNDKEFQNNLGRYTLRLHYGLSLATGHLLQTHRQ